jgi:enterochelin esterase-like enzyme
LILTGESPAFIIVFPDDRAWNLKAGPSFGDRLIQDLIPYVDETYRTRSERDYRAMGGLSRGGAWTVHLGLQYWEMFGALGLHSPAVASEDRPYLSRLISEIPPESLPRFWLDIGDRDTGLNNARRFEDILTYYTVPHEWHQYAGDHTENYWSQHVDEYLRWYMQGWLAVAAPQTPVAEDE